MRLDTPDSAAEWMRETATAFMQGPVNDLLMPGGPEPAFDLPLLGFAAGSDPIWQSYKEHVADYHWTPEEAFALAFPADPAPASSLSVVSWILPQTKQTKLDQRKEKELPAERWARARVLGEPHVHEALRKHMVDSLAALGVRAVSPMLLPEWSRRDSDKFFIASNWSERHAAYAAGLGTFGLCDGLITPVGKAMRTGSLVVELSLPVTQRPYEHYQEYCLYFSSGKCGACIKRCPAGAIGPQGHDKRRCQAYIREVTAPYVEATWGMPGYGCGTCQVRVPCESRIPGRR